VRHGAWLAKREEAMGPLLRERREALRRAGEQTLTDRGG
jgi:hypothetical protein